MPKYVPTVTNRAALKFARLCMNCGSMADAADAARRMARRIPGSARRRGTWKYFLVRFARAIDAGALPHEIFAMKGNVKLPFVAFSTLPIVTCPGAGSCAGIERRGGAPDLKKAWCYSLRAWRYPAAFLRQCMNTLLLRFNRRAVIDAFRALPQGVTFRLYVDGDFDSAETAIFWFNLLRQRPDIAAYGYSKSWEILRPLDHMRPANYLLNLSSGGLADDEQQRAGMRGLTMTRGDFIALPIVGDFGRGFSRYQNPAYHAAVREAARAAGIERAFSCPGDCGDCTPLGHACGAQKPNGLPILTGPVVIGIHGGADGLR